MPLIRGDVTPSSSRAAFTSTFQQSNMVTSTGRPIPLAWTLRLPLRPTAQCRPRWARGSLQLPPSGTGHSRRTTMHIRARQRRAGARRGQLHGMKAWAQRSWASSFTPLSITRQLQYSLRHARGGRALPRHPRSPHQSSRLRHTASMDGTGYDCTRTFTTNSTRRFRPISTVVRLPR